MTNMKKAAFSAIACLVLGATTFRIHAQNVSPVYGTRPVFPGFQLPSAAGTLRYSLTLSGGATIGYNGQNQTFYAPTFSGNAAYLSRAETHPFAVVYSGGYQLAASNQASSPYQDLAISQSFLGKRWQFVASDSVSYLPRTPIGGLAGLPGLGDLSVGATLPLGAYLGTGLESDYAPQVSNQTSATLTRSLTSRTSLSGSGSFGVQRFVGDVPGIDNNTLSAAGTLSHRLSATSSVAGTYSFSRYTYSQYGVAYNSNAASASYSRQWTRNFSTVFSGGPLFTSSPGGTTTASYNLGAAANYQSPYALLNISFSRFTNAGSGITFAVRSNTLQGSASRRLGARTSGSVSGGYSDSVSLPTFEVFQTSPFSFHSVYGAVQVSHALSSSFSVYGSYTVQHQLQNANAFALNSLTGTQQTISAGITYSPRAITLGH